jgi:hypothetical protein
MCGRSFFVRARSGCGSSRRGSRSSNGPFEGEQWDCDNYANCFVTFADLLALRSGESRGTLGVGWATVYYRRPFAGIEGGAHAVVIAATGEGLFVIEPQDGTMVPIEKFPNRDTIEAVYF